MVIFHRFLYVYQAGHIPHLGTFPMPPALKGSTSIGELQESVDTSFGVPGDEFHELGSGRVPNVVGW